MLKKVEHFCHQAIVVSFCALIFFLPISIALTETCSALAIFLYLVKKILQGAGQGWRVVMPKPCFLNKAVGLNVVAVFISVLFSRYFDVSFYAFFAKFLEGIFLYLAFVEGFSDRRSFLWFIGVFLFSGFWVSLSGLWQFLGHPDFIRGNVMIDNRVSSSLGRPNDFGAYLIIVVVLLWGLLDFSSWESKGKKWLHVFLAITAVLASFALGLTFSRGAWVGLIFGMGVYAFWCHRKMLTCFFLIIFFLVFMPLMNHFRQASFFSDNVTADHMRVQHVISQERHKNSKDFLDLKARWDTIKEFGGDGRISFWRDAVGVIRASPVYGMGLNTYARVAKKAKFNWTGYPHNCYLQMAAEEGLIGLATFLFLIFRLFQEVFLLSRRKSDAFLRGLVLVVGAGLAGFLVESFFDTTLYSVQSGNLLWILIGFIAAAVETGRKLTKQASSL